MRISDWSSDVCSSDLCTGCQRMTASAYSLSLAVPSAGFAVTSGEPAIGGLHGPTRHFFCPWCKSWMFTRPEGLDEIVNLRAILLDDHGWFVPFAEFWTREKRSEEHTSELQSLMRLSYAVFCLKK